MPTVTPIKKNDEVYILAGKDRGKTGRVLIVLPQDKKIVVEGVQMIKRHTRPNPQRNIQGGIVEREAAIHISNLALEDPKDGKPTRVGFKFLKDGRKVRFARRSGEVIDG